MFRHPMLASILVPFCVVALCVAAGGCSSDDSSPSVGSDAGGVDPPDGTTAGPAADGATADGPAESDAAASSSGGDAQTVEDDGTGDPNSGPPAAVWSPGAAIFNEVTMERGLEGVIGVRFSVTDYDGDGWPDLFVRQGGGPDDFSDGGDRNRWLLRNTGDGHFEDVTQSSGIFTPRKTTSVDFGRPGEVIISGDVDNDGDLDVFVASGSAGDETSELMLNNGDGTFALGPEASYARANGIPAGSTFVDYDLDGFLDLFIVHNMGGGMSSPLQDRLLRGDGTGVFVDVTSDVGLATKGWSDLDQLNAAQGHSWAWGAASCDLNNDGLQELLAASYGRSPNQLWQAVPVTETTVGFVNQSVASGYAFDHREDWTDNVGARCHCRDIPADPDCDLVDTDVDPAVCESFIAAFGQYRWDHDNDREPWRLGGNSATTFCADIDNDGWIDLYTSEIVHWDVGPSSDPGEVAFNVGEYAPRFERPGDEALGIERFDETTTWDHGDMTGAVFDFDNDGWADLLRGSAEYPGNKAWLYHQKAPRSFERVEFADFFEHNRAHGMAIADFDRDGDLDVIIGHSHFRCGGDLGLDCYPTRQVRLFDNVFGDAGTHWVQLRLVGGEGSNRAAIGARVEVTAGAVTQTQQVGGGHGHFGAQRDPTLHFGLGEASEASVRIVWPNRDRTEQTFEIATGKRYTVTQGEAPVPVE